ncbi:hypothetical protein PC123_g19431 [Phytophthora cactorum]|nr:hypothetical protein PC120_g23614 [Phytophthora cactorum]KAG4045149.1 hypothetical protein PC123_g19431 [Phytophthora cactorum]
MSSTVLLPPNFQSLSQDVIIHVRQRTRALHVAVDVGVMGRPSCHFPPSGKPGSSLWVDATTRTRSTLSQYKDITTLVNTEQPGVEDDGSGQPSHELCNNTKAANRERHRKNQERYRLRQKKMNIDLDHTIRKLRDEIQYLKSQRTSIYIGNSKHITLQNVVSEYFRVFRRGFVEPDGSRIPALDYLRLSMAPDLDAGTVLGFEALARNWGVFTKFFRDVRVQLDSVEHTTAHSVVARTTISVTITEVTLRDVFLYRGRHSCSGSPDQQERGRHIAAKLLGQRLVMCGSVSFTWDSSTDQVVGLISQADMVSPLLQLMGNIEDVSNVLSNARVTPECNLVIGEYMLGYPLYC